MAWVWHGEGRSIPVKMRSFILQYALVLLISAGAQSQNLRARQNAMQKNIPEAVKETFSKENPDADAKWKMEDTNYRAEFLDASNIAHIRVYSKKGAMIYRDDVMESYPAPIHAYYASRYPGEGFAIWSRIDAKGNMSFYAYRNSDTLWFDKDGNYQSPKKNKSGFKDSISVMEPLKN
jgi:hypothetical protein